MKMGESQRTFNDVVTYQADANFAVKTINIPNLAVEVQPGSVIKADGTAYTSGSDVTGSEPSPRWYRCKHHRC
jgi:hypothetical protein